MAELTEAEAAQVRDWVQRRGFHLTSDLGSQSFGDEERIWERNNARVRLTRDRGQWWCELSYRGCPEWFDLDLAARALGSKFPDVEGRIGDVIDKFSDGRLLEPLRAYRGQGL